MIADDVLAFALKHWRAIAGGLILAGLSIALLLAKADARHWRKRFDQEAALHQLDLANVRTATAQAHAADLKHAADVKARDDAIAQETQRDLETRLADARSVAADYARRMRATPADQGGGRAAGDAAVADAAGGADGTGSEALVYVTATDVEICAENTIKAMGWQEWWGRVSADPR